MKYGKTFLRGFVYLCMLILWGNGCGSRYSEEHVKEGIVEDLTGENGTELVKLKNVKWMCKRKWIEGTSWTGREVDTKRRIMMRSTMVVVTGEMENLSDKAIGKVELRLRLQGTSPPCPMVKDYAMRSYIPKSYIPNLVVPGWMDGRQKGPELGPKETRAFAIAMGVRPDTYPVRKVLEIDGVSGCVVIVK